MMPSAARRRPRRPAGIAASEPAAPPVVHTAIVHAADGVRLLEVGTSRAAVEARLADYVRAHLAERLWPDDAERVSRLLARARWEAAVDHYFACVGARWDDEWLYRGTSRIVSEHSLAEAVGADGRA